MRQTCITVWIRASFGLWLWKLPVHFASRIFLVFYPPLFQQYYCQMEHSTVSSRHHQEVITNCFFCYLIHFWSLCAISDAWSVHLLLHTSGFCSMHFLILNQGTEVTLDVYKSFGKGTSASSDWHIRKTPSKQKARSTSKVLQAMFLKHIFLRKRGWWLIRANKTRRRVKRFFTPYTQLTYWQVPETWRFCSISHPAQLGKIWLGGI